MFLGVVDLDPPLLDTVVLSYRRYPFQRQTACLDGAQSSLAGKRTDCQAAAGCRVLCSVLPAGCEPAKHSSRRLRGLAAGACQQQRCASRINIFDSTRLEVCTTAAAMRRDNIEADAACIVQWKRSCQRYVLSCSGLFCSAGWIV